MRKTDEKTKRIDNVLPGLKSRMKKCDLCRKRCRVDRISGELGSCRAGTDVAVYTYGPHHGEEPALSGDKGSGTIFFSRCSMHCVYCQNNQFSQADAGREVSPEELGDRMLEMAAQGCHNINLVTPTHIVPGILEGLRHAYKGGLDIPVVYNTGGYDSPELIRALEGIVDIYLPDMRYSSDKMAKKYSSAPGYVENNRNVVLQMQRQVGSLEIDDEGIALRGLIIRLLVMPNGISGTEDTLEFIHKSIGDDVLLSVMSQYYPAHKASKYPELARRITGKEYRAITDKLDELGMENGWVQPFEGDFDDSFAGENFAPGV